MDKAIQVGNFAVNLSKLDVTKIGPFEHLHEACHNGQHWQLVGVVLADVIKDPDYIIRFRHPNTLPEDTGPAAIIVEFGSRWQFKRGNGNDVDFMHPDFKKIWPSGFWNMVAVINALEVYLEPNSYALRFWRWVVNNTHKFPKEVR